MCDLENGTLRKRQAGGIRQVGNLGSAGRTQRGKQDRKTDRQTAQRDHPGLQTQLQPFPRKQKLTLLCSHRIRKWKRTLFSDQINRNNKESTYSVAIWYHALPFPFMSACTYRYVCVGPLPLTFSMTVLLLQSYNKGLDTFGTLCWFLLTFLNSLMIAIMII